MNPDDTIVDYVAEARQGRDYSSVSVCTELP